MRHTQDAMAKMKELPVQSGFYQVTAYAVDFVKQALLIISLDYPRVLFVC